MKTETAILAAAVLGTIAFNEGRKATPCQDKALMEIIANRENKEWGSTLPIMKAWSDAWHAANLA
jgi:hypothetical protein